MPSYAAKSAFPIAQPFVLWYNYTSTEFYRRTTMKNIRNVFLLIISAIILLFASCDRPHDNDASHVHTVVMDEAVEPKCTVDGLTEGSHCSACNEIIVAQQNIPALGHTAITDEAIPPSCISVPLQSIRLQSKPYQESTDVLPEDFQ